MSEHRGRALGGQGGAQVCPACWEASSSASIATGKRTALTEAGLAEGTVLVRSRGRAYSSDLAFIRWGGSDTQANMHRGRACEETQGEGNCLPAQQRGPTRSSCPGLRRNRLQRP